MSESRIDNHRVRYDPRYDAMVDVKRAIEANTERIMWERKEWHRQHDAPPEGYGIDGRPLMRVKSGRVKSEETGGDG